jgi:hypothetical protein
MIKCKFAVMAQLVPKVGSLFRYGERLQIRASGGANNPYGDGHARNRIIDVLS